MPKPKDPVRGEMWSKRQRESHKRLFLTRKHPRLGIKLSREAKERISKANRGKVPWNKGKKNFLGPKEKHPWFGRHHVEETKRKISESQRGKIPWNKGKTGLQQHTAESRRKISETLKYRYAREPSPLLGRHLSLETRRKISVAIRGENHPLYGKPLSAEHKRKLLEANKGRKISEETRQKLSKSHKGIKPSSEARRRCSESLTGHSVSDETRQKISSTRIFRSTATGKNNPMWKGGITPLGLAIRSSITYKLWREAIFIRDSFQCQDCGDIGVILHAHHVYPFEKILKELNITSVEQAIQTEAFWEIFYGITLCEKCHKKRHKQRSQTLEKVENLSDHRHSPGGHKAISSLERVGEISR